MLEQRILGPTVAMTDRFHELGTNLIARGEECKASFKVRGPRAAVCSVGVLPVLALHVVVATCCLHLGCLHVFA